MAWVVFWVALGLAGVVTSWLGFRRHSEAEKTIRLAIEKGVLTDAQLVAQLRQPSGTPLAHRLTVLGLIAVALAAGVAIFAGFIGREEPESLNPLLGIAAFVGCTACGLLASGWWLARENKRASDH